MNITALRNVRFYWFVCKILLSFKNLSSHSWHFPFAFSWTNKWIQMQIITYLPTFSTTRFFTYFCWSFLLICSLFMLKITFYINIFSEVVYAKWLWRVKVYLEWVNLRALRNNWGSSNICLRSKRRFGWL